MFGHLTYIIWLIAFVAAPLVALAAWERRALWQQRRTLGWMLAGSLAGGWAWDVLAVHIGAWYYDPLHIVNVWIGGLPLEEWLWIFGVSLLFGCVTISVEDRVIKHQLPHSISPGETSDVINANRCLVLGVWLSFATSSTLELGRYSQLVMLLGSGVIFNAILWARNAAFLWHRRRTILIVVGIAEVWQLITDPIGGWWGAWYFDAHKVLGVWLFGVTPIEDLLGIATVACSAACAVLVFGYSSRRWI